MTLVVNAGEARKELMRHTGGPGGEIMKTFYEMCLCIGRKFCTEFIRGNQTFTEALEGSGLEKFPVWMRDLWFKHFGHTIMSAFYYGVRDVQMKGQPDINDYRSIFDTAEELRRKLGYE